MAPDPWQERLLCWTGDKLLLNCARQSGKSQFTAILAAYRAITKPGSLVLLVSPSQRQSGELFAKVKDVFAALPRRPKLLEDNKTSLTLQNRSRIVSLPDSPDTIRGYSSVDLIVLDEAAFASDELLIAIRPMLMISRGRLVMMSTPKGKRGAFYDAWVHGEGYERIKVTVYENPRQDLAKVEDEKSELLKRGLADMFRQEYLCEFVDAAAGRVYGKYDPERSLIDALPEGRWHYVLGLDFGIVDANGLSVLAWRAHDPTVYVVRSYRFTGTPTEMAREVQSLVTTYAFERIVGDEGGMGKAFAEEMRRRFSIPVQPADKANKNGAIAILNGELADGRVKVLRSGTEQLQDEWLKLPWAEGGQKEASDFDNHASDATLYAHRACPNYHERAKELPPPPGTEEWTRAEEQRLERAAVERVLRDESERMREAELAPWEYGI